MQFGSHLVVELVVVVQRKDWVVAHQPVCPDVYPAKPGMAVCSVEDVVVVAVVVAAAAAAAVAAVPVAVD